MTLLLSFDAVASDSQLLDTVTKFWHDTGIMQFFEVDNGYLNLIMILVSFLLMYLAIVEKYEPLLLLPIAFGMLLTNLPGANLYTPDLWDLELHGGHIEVAEVLQEGALLDLLYLGVKLGIYPPLIFLGVGAMTDFGPLIANPKSLLLGAAAQLGIFVAFFGALFL